MTNLRQAAQQALEDLQDANGMAYSEFSVEDLYGETITALRAALAEPKEEPVAMRYDFDGYGYRYIDSGSGSNWQTRHKDAEPLYTAPTPQTDQKPVAWMDIDEHGQRHGLRYYSDGNRDEVPLYTSAPAPRKPVELTNEELLTIYTNHVNDEKWGYERAVIAAYEAKNGITGEQT